MSTLPGGYWTDRPGGVPSTVAALVVAVNDATSDAQRPALMPLAPWLASVPVTDAAQTARVVAVSASRAALPLAGAGVVDRLRVEASAAARTVSRGGVAGWWLRRSRRRSAARAVRLAVEVVRGAGGDRGLRDLLVGSLDAWRLVGGLAPVPLLDRPAEDCAAELAVRCELRAHPGSDSASLYCTAVLDSWPDWLRDRWVSQKTGKARADFVDVCAIGTRSTAVS
ncbi:hypothetical protein BKA01_003010 [Pseudonocardia eucalypti]|uniref:hypothetical protein n=1 Tax=Pseudonocardia eucalypti TaxID=648755 RepID=UPI00161A6F38|nr:hypothetical protein [Pseudonocardia eucalypti]